MTDLQEARPAAAAELRIDTREKVTGQALYVEDLPDLPGIAYGAPLQSPYAHARIVSVDSTMARRLPGVLAVLDRENAHEFPVHPERRPTIDPGFICTDRARFEGDFVAMVVADDLRTARRTVGLIRIEYELLPPVFSASEALAGGAPLVHDDLQTNSAFDDSFEWGDVERGLREADVVLDQEFISPTVFHHPMEPAGSALASFTGEVAELWVPTNTPVRDARDVAKLLDLPPDRVRLRVPNVGGGFGCKKTTREMVAALAMSRRLGRPIKLVATGGESFHVAVRHAMTYHGKMGLKRDGRIHALDVDILVDCGAYFAGGRTATHNACISAWGAYRIPHFRARARTAYTNKVPATPHRGTGKTQTTFAIESMLDAAARKLGLDPLDLRQRNVLLPGERVAERWKVRGEQVDARTPPIDVDFPDLMNRALKAIGSQGESQRESSHAQGDLRRGIGVALSLRHSSKGEEASHAMAALQPDGTVVIYHNAADLGQGIYNMIGLVAARTLGLAGDQVRVEKPDTGIDLPFTGSSAQRTTVQMGNAVQAACQTLRTQILDLAAEAWGGDVQSWGLRAGRLWRGSESFALSKLLSASGVAKLEARGTDRDVAEDRAFGAFDHWSPGVAAAEVEVDTATGEVRVLKYAILADAGTVLHYPSARGQLEGGAVMGFGIALGEELVYEDGQVLNADAFQYRLPLNPDMPPVFATLMLERGDGPGPFGSKGIAQTSIPCVAPAIGNAIADAIGVTLTATPFTAERVLRALGNVGAEG